MLRASEFCATDPYNATTSDVDRGEALLIEFAHSPGISGFVEVALRLSSIYLELRDGDRAANVERAMALQRAVHSFDLTWEQRFSVTIEAANAVVRHPAATIEQYDWILSELDAVRQELEGANAPVYLARALTSSAMVLEKRPLGDRTDALEQALILRRRALATLEESGSDDAQFLGLCLHNLGYCEMEQLSGVRPDHVDRAITAFRRALEFRTQEANPAGRLRTLRALAAAYPEWTGTELPLDAQELADAAQAEADELAAALSAAGRDNNGWAAFTHLRSALHVDLDGLASDLQAADDSLSEAIRWHRDAVDAHPVQSMPNQWADWVAGLARLLAARYRVLGDARHMGEAFELFEAALDVVDSEAQPYLCRDVNKALGEAAHAYEDWRRSRTAHEAALQLSDRIARRNARTDTRSDELKTTRSCAVFAAYAAARLGEREHAVELAERGRCRSLADWLWSVEIELESVDTDARESIERARREVLELEEQLRDQADPLEVLRGKIADFAGVSAESIGMRQTAPTWDDRDVAAAARIEMSRRLSAARQTLDRSMSAALERSDRDPLAMLPFDVIAQVASRAGYPLIYLVPTMHGSIALALTPDGRVTTIGIDWLTSSMTSRLLYGDADAGGYLFGLLGDDAALEAAIEPALAVADAVLDALGELVTRAGYSEAALIPLGSIGLLPMHAGGDGTVTFRIVPSARVLAVGLRSQTSSEPRRRALVALGAPDRDDLDPLPCSTTETELCAALFRRSGTSVELREAVGARTVLALCASGSHLHVACHAEYRPSDPMSSVIFTDLGAGLSLADIVHGRDDLAHLELAVLSACHTAATDMTNSDDAFGFPAQLLAAGVQGVVATAWPVADDAAAFFSYRFYNELLDGTDPALALVSARNWLRHATERDLHRVVDDLLELLANHGEREQDELRDTLAANLDPSGNDCPFGHPADWAAFGYWGV